MSQLPPKTVWVTGAAGLIGAELVRTAPAQVRAVPVTREQVDLTDFTAVREALHRDQPDLILHAAALSKPVDCQRDPALAFRINAELPGLLTDEAGPAPVWLLSTDLVFDGSRGGYREVDEVSPVNVYGETKVAAEAAVLANPANAVFRLSMNGGVSARGDRGFNEEFRQTVLRGQPMTLFRDEYRCPIAARWTAETLWRLVERADVAGMFHLCGGQKLSRLEIGQLLVRRWGLTHAELREGSVRDYQGPRRSPDTSMRTDKLAALLGEPCPGLGEWLERNPAEPF